MNLKKQITLLERLTGKRVALKEADIEAPPHDLYGASYFSLTNLEQLKRLPIFDTWRGMEIKQEDSETYFILNNEIVVVCGIDDQSKPPTMGGIEVNKKYRQKGFGLSVYEYYINKYNGILSDLTISPDALALWKSLARKYKVEVVDYYDHNKKISSNIDDVSKDAYVLCAHK